MVLKLALKTWNSCLGFKLPRSSFLAECLSAWCEPSSLFLECEEELKWLFGEGFCVWRKVLVEVVWWCSI